MRNNFVDKLRIAFILVVQSSVHAWTYCVEIIIHCAIRELVLTHFQIDSHDWFKDMKVCAEKSKIIVVYKNGIPFFYNCNLKMTEY